MIKFHDILREIGINNPNRLKATISSTYDEDNGDIDYIKIDDFEFWDGNVNNNGEFPDYWCWVFGPTDIENFRQWYYFKYFEELKSEHNLFFYGIPKSKVQII